MLKTLSVSKMFKYTSKSLIIGVCTVFFIYCQTSYIYAEKAPKFFLSNLEGDRFYSKKNNNIIVSFFFIDCVPCKKEIPQLYQLVKKENLNSKLLFVDPLKDDTREEIKHFANQINVPTTLFYHDTFGNMALKFAKGKMVFPTIIGIKNKVIIFRIHDLKENSIKLLLDNFSK